MSFSVEQIRRDFPTLDQKVHGKPLVYFDNAATTHKPQSVITRLHDFYSSENSNIHRGIHLLSELATTNFEAVRKKVQSFINAPQEKEIIFVRGVTEGFNLLASSFSKAFLNEGDEILISSSEHHANIVPWQIACAEHKATLKVIPVDDQGDIILEEAKALLTEKTKLLSFVHISNALGVINPAKELIALAHKKNIPVALDGAQSAPHMPIDVQDLDCDFYLFSGHKVFGPTGIGVLWGKEKYLSKMPPYQGGGDMIEHVSFEGTTYKEIPAKFEAGTPHIAGVIGLGEAIDYLTTMDRSAALAHENELCRYALDALRKIENVHITVQPKNRASIINFTLEGIHAYDATSYLDSDGIAIRTGLHCAEPLMRRLGKESTMRASLAFYNTDKEIDQMISSLQKMNTLFL